MDPVLSKLRLIAEPWDAGGAYQLGRSFPGITWQQWNGAFRDDVRRFVRGDSGMVGRAMLRMYGSDDLFPDASEHAYRAFQSINYVTSHDGFTLYDLVSSEQRRNEANGHGNTDGPSETFSWNGGWEGDGGVPENVVRLRVRQAKNFFAMLLLSNGTPMIRSGDEFLNTQWGNSNPYNQDNEVAWLSWDRRERFEDVHHFAKAMIAFRKAHPSLCRSRHWRDAVRWFGPHGDVDSGPSSRAFAFFLDGTSECDDDLYVMVNAHSEPVRFSIFAPGTFGRVIDTAAPPGEDALDPDSAPRVGAEIEVDGRAVVVLLSACRAAPARTRG